MNSYELSHKWFNWCLDNPEKIAPTHTALYFYAIECCNRNEWREKFNFPTDKAMFILGIKSYKTYVKILTNLIDWGFIKMIQKSKNQYTANIIAMVNFTEALTEADNEADKWLSKDYQSTYQSTYQSNDQSNASILKQYKTIKTKKQSLKIEIPEFSEFLKFAKNEMPLVNEYSLKAKYDDWVENNWHDGNNSAIVRWKTKLRNTLPYLPQSRITENLIPDPNKRKEF